MNDSYVMALEELLEKCVAAMRTVGEALKIIWENASEVLEGIKAFFKKKQTEQETKAGWYVPNKIILTSQVLNRKPRMAVARSRL
ncbi:hypothetical protein [Bacillus sp. MRMR6]|uniref:hypothetical protein n=1 Tax=Bacillus sp. MRMR6 TaxID=1928617 RepID=UPI000950BD06|nr:hypothetical protein [Bacillus sp. MRMR6]OLS39126.1 hypothetical protein BTR25_13420 [Bacillus sp. MRMR6]